MALNGRLSVEFDLTSPVIEFFHNLQMSGLAFNIVKMKEPKLEPEEKNKVEYRLEGLKISEWYKARKVTSDLEKLWYKSIFSKDSDVAKREDPDRYTKLEGTMIITETVYKNRRSCRMIWTVEFEKIPDDDIPEPRFITEFTAEYLQDIDRENIKC